MLFVLKNLALSENFRIFAIRERQNNMEKKDLLKFCRYYKGDDNKAPANTSPEYTAWKIERLWVNQELEVPEQVEQCISDYVRYGLADYKMFDDTPAALKAVLINRFFQYTERIDVEEFKKFYEKFYS